MTPELPVVGCVAPAASPSPTPTPTSTPTPTPAATPTALPTQPAAPSVTVAPDVAVIAAPAPVVLVPEAVVVVPAPLAVVPVSGVQATATPAPVEAGMPLTSVVPSAYAIVVFGLIGVALLVSFLSGLRPTSPLGGTMKTRLWTGLGVIAAAAVVGGIGWYKIAGEPLLNRQIPFLASAGIAVVVLTVLGGALIVSEQLRADQNRIGELEGAVRALTEALSPLVEQPARRVESDALLQ